MSFISVDRSPKLPPAIHQIDLGAALHALVVAHFKFGIRQSNGLLEQEAGRLGLEVGSDFAVVHVRIGDRNAALVAIPSRHWRSKDTMVPFYRLKATSHWQGETVVLIPEAFVTREPRCSNSLMIAASRGTNMSVSDRMAILEHLIEFESATLSELGGMIAHPDPISAVLSLVVEGLIDIDLDRPILPTSPVSMGVSR